MEEKDKLYLHINVVMDRDTDKQEYFWNKISSYLESMGMECLGSSEYQPVERIPEIKKLKCMNSQKTKDELWNRLWKEFGQLVYMEGMNEHIKEGANGDLVDFIAAEISKAREEVERKFVEKYHKRGEEMNVPYSEEDGKEFWQGYKEGYNQGLKDMIVDTYYLDKEFELKLKDNK